MASTLMSALHLLVVSLSVVGACIDQSCSDAFETEKIKRNLLNRLHLSAVPAVSERLSAIAIARIVKLLSGEDAAADNTAVCGEKRSCSTPAHQAWCFHFRISATQCAQIAHHGRVVSIKVHVPAHLMNESFVAVLGHSLPSIDLNVSTTDEDTLEAVIDPEVFGSVCLAHVLPLRLACSTCDAHRSVEDGPMTFMTWHSGAEALLHRERRQIDCVDEMAACCRRPLTVNFGDFGWDQWILHPHRFLAYYCQGLCNEGIYKPATTWAMVMQNFAETGHTAVPNVVVTGHTREAKQSRSTARLCCAPIVLSSLQIIHYNDIGEILRSTVPSLVVEECGCV